MEFFNRETELNILREVQKRSESGSRMSVVVGRRRIGKTELIRRAYPDSLYLFVSKKSEKLLCAEFTSLIQNFFNKKIIGKIENFRDIFEYLMQISAKRQFTLIIDEFQEFNVINPSVYSEMQNLWDQYRKQGSMNLVLSGSIYSLMKKIFENRKEPLFGRADIKINLEGFSVETLKKILNTHTTDFKNRDLLSFYILTGGVPEYVELLIDRQAFTFYSQMDILFEKYSVFLDEGKNLLIEEFGKEYSVYFSILSLIASSKTSRTEMESILEKNIGGYIDRLEKEYSVIKRIRPLFGKPGTKRIKYEISDNFLNFWFRFIYKYKSAIEIENYGYVKSIVKRDFASYSGKFLEKFFIEKFKSSNRYTNIGNYWERGYKNEIDIIGINEEEKKVDFFDVKLNPEKIDLDSLKEKSRKITPYLKGYKACYKGLSVRDM